MVTALPDSPLLRLVKSMERETFSPIGRVPASEAGPAFSEPGLVGEGQTVGAVNSRCGISRLGVSRVDRLLPSSRGSGGRGGASSSKSFFSGRQDVRGLLGARMREATSAIRGCYSGRPGGANNPRPPHPCAVIAGLREAGTRYIRAAGPGPRNLCQAQLTRRDGVGWDPSPPPRPRNPFRSCLHQRKGFSPSTVSIDHILHGLKRACSLGQEAEDRVNDTLQ